jgi:hypothetical protein
MHRILDLEEMRYNEQIQAQEQYTRDLNQMQASREMLWRSCRRLQMAHREASRMESDAQRDGNLLVYSLVCRERRTRNACSHRTNPIPTCQWGGG